MTVVVVAPHMDDEVLGCGGVLQRFDAATVVFVTTSRQDRRLVDGAYVEYDGRARVEEMGEVADLLGFTPVALGLPVHELDQVGLAGLIARLEEHAADAELLLIPACSHDEDHNVVWRACQALRRPHFGRFSVLEYRTWGCPDPLAPVVLVPLSFDELGDKLRALRLYASQIAPTKRRDPAYPYDPTSVMAYAMATGRLCHADAAEAFTPVRLIPNDATARLLGA